MSWALMLCKHQRIYCVFLAIFRVKVREFVVWCSEKAKEVFVRRFDGNRSFEDMQWYCPGRLEKHFGRTFVHGCGVFIPARKRRTFLRFGVVEVHLISCLLIRGRYRGKSSRWTPSRWHLTPQTESDFNHSNCRPWESRSTAPDPVYENLQGGVRQLVAGSFFYVLICHRCLAVCLSTRKVDSPSVCWRKW
jgi:hypothetical protein